MATVAIFTTPEGHASIAEAIAEALRDEHRVETLTTHDVLFKLYTPIYQLFPTAFKVPYKLSQQATFRAGFQRVMEKKLQRTVEHFLIKTNADVAICVHFLYLPALERVCAERRIKLINIITDPWTFHPLLISPAAHSNLIFDQRTLQVCQDMNPDARYDIAGWFVREQFYQKDTQRQQAIRAKLKLRSDMQTLLVAGGSEGTMMVMKLVPALLQLEKPVQVLVLCGNNTHLNRTIRSVSRIMQSVPKNTPVPLPVPSRVIPIGFTKHVADYIGVADLVVGKAGPNTIFEAVAGEKPFFAITHISGQEDGNLELIKEYGIGFVEENSHKAVALLQDILRAPEQLRQFTPKLRKLATLNRASAAKIREIVAR